MSSYVEFYNSRINKGFDHDGYFGAQCWDGYVEYCKYLGYGWANCTTSGYVMDIWNNRHANGILNYFDEVTVMEPGDVAVFKEDPNWTPYSHIAIFHSDAGDGYGWFFGQNQGGTYYPGGGSCFNLCKLPYSATFDTAFRPKCFASIEVVEENKTNSEEVFTMKVVDSILTNNPCYTDGRKITVKGLMLHSVGCSQPNASVFIKAWNSASYDRACVHGFIDANDGTVYQTLPWNHRGWHAGGYANDTHIGVEMCEPDCINYTGGSSFTCSNKDRAVEMVKRTYNSAVELFASLCKEYKLNPMEKGVVISHKEGCTLGVASNHGDPEHLWKGLGLSYTMDTFRSDVKKAMGSSTTETKPTITASKELYRVRKSWDKPNTQLGAYSVLSNAKAMSDKNPGYNVYDSNGKLVYPVNGYTSSSAKTVDEIAKEVIDGKWGNGSDRKNRLTNAGYDYCEVQARVNQLLG